MPLQPMEGRVLLKVLHAETCTPGGIVLPDCAKDKPSRGTIVALGPEIPSDPPGVRIGLAVGDTALFRAYTGTELTIDGEAHRIVEQKDLLAKVVD